MKRSLFLLSLGFCLALVSCSGDHSSEAVPAVVAEGPIQYVLEDISGTVLIQTAGETQAEPAEEEQAVQAGDEVITRDGAEATLTLNETTLFHLSENSDVKLDQLERNNSGGFLSRVNLVAGKVLSEVEKLSETQSTFEVNAGGVVCGVRGTSFEVEKQDSDVQTSTYNGVVQVQKDNNSQTVEANQHCAYSGGQGAFLPKRELTADEKARYENWKGKMAQVREKTRQRFKSLRAIDKMPPEKKEQMRQQMNGVKGKDRLKVMRQMSQGNPGPNGAPGSRPQGPPGREMPQRMENQRMMPARGHRP